MEVVISAIAALVLNTFIEAGTSTAGQVLAKETLEKLDLLRRKVWEKLRGIPEVDELKSTFENGGEITEAQVKLFEPHLKSAMDIDKAFAEEVKRLAIEIEQQINIYESPDANTINNYGNGNVTAVKQNLGQMFTGNINNVNLGPHQPLR